MRSNGFASWVASLTVVAGAVVALLPTACTTQQATPSTYFERSISPILTTSCVHGPTSGQCHVADPKGNAVGNLDLSLYAGVNTRRDLLLDYGPYGQPALLVKNVPPYQIDVQSYDGTKVTITTDIKHTGLSILDPTGGEYQTLRRWIDNGATENNTGVPPADLVRLACTDTIPPTPGFNPNVDPPNPDFPTFRDTVIPVIAGSCAASNCHGSEANELYFTCGSSPQEVRWNYYSASLYLASTPEQSELLRRPLNPSQGGSFHEGGIIFQSPSDSGYQALLAWITKAGPPPIDNSDAAFGFFVHRVQPILVKKGCMMLQCHSASMFHDYRLRGGSGGAFSLSASKKNYALSLQQISIESDDPAASRLIRKNLYRPDTCDCGGPGPAPTSGADGGSAEAGAPATVACSVIQGCDTAQGIIHRGGSLFEDFSNQRATQAACDAASPPYDYDNGNLDQIPAYCVISEWIKRERTAFNLAPLSGIVYVKRPPPPAPDRPQDFDVYSPGAELHLVKATLANGAITPGADTVLNAGCGLDPTTADIRRPAVSWDGTKVAFAARASASAGFQIYEMNADGSNCAPNAFINSYAPPTTNGLLVHNFDPQYSPPDASNAEHLVFASTRGNTDNPGAFDYSGPQRTPADPTKPNSNLYVYEPDPNNAGQFRVRQLTSLLNMERYPTFMQDGRINMTTEKRSPGFYQLALRRQNLDGGDYHPLYAQRLTIGYSQAAQVVEMAHKDFAAIFSDQKAIHGGGTLAVFNRSIGVDFTDPTPADYLEDPSVIDPNALLSPEPAFFNHSLRFPDATASGHGGSPTTGVYSSPAILPDGLLLVSWGAASDPATFDGDYDIYVLNPIDGTKTKIIGSAGTMETEAVAIFARAAKGIFNSTFDEPNGHSIVYDGKQEADVTVLDMNTLATLLFQNTPAGRQFVNGPNGRSVEQIPSFDVLEDLPPPPSYTAFDGSPAVATDAFGKVYVQRRLLGNVPLASDGSAHFQIPGGVPIVLHLPDTDASRAQNLPRTQREEMMFVAGEYVHQSFRADFFNAVCAGCHVPISGRPLDFAAKPDILTQASQVAADNSQPLNLNIAPGQRGPIQGPPAN